MGTRYDYERKRLTPLRVIAFYLLVTALVSLNELERLASWFGDRCENWTTDVSWCERPQELMLSKGARHLSTHLLEMENSLTAFIQQLPLLGENLPMQVAAAQPPPQTEQPVLTPATQTVTAQLPQTVASTNEASAALPRLHPGKVLIVGDSMVEGGFGLALQRRLKQFSNLSIVREGIHSTGLTRPDYFDWMAHLQTLLNKHHPDLLIVNMGANDPQDIAVQGKRHYVGDAAWNTMYSSRVKQFISLAAERGVTTFWVGMPVMGKTAYGKKVHTINSLVAQACAEQKLAEYFDTWNVLTAADGTYTPFMPNARGERVRVRAKDGIHLTDAGGEIMTSHFLSASKPYVSWSSL